MAPRLAAITRYLQPAGTGRPLRNPAPKSHSIGERCIGNHRENLCLAFSRPAPHSWSWPYPEPRAVLQVDRRVVAVHAAAHVPLQERGDAGPVVADLQVAQVLAGEIDCNQTAAIEVLRMVPTRCAQVSIQRPAWAHPRAVGTPPAARPRPPRRAAPGRGARARRRRAAA